MKTRQGFVSNSSSSSFVLSVDKDKADEPVMVSLDISSAVDHIITNQTQLDKYIFTEYEYGESNLKELLEENEGAKERYDEILEEIQKGKAVLIGWCSNEADEGIRQFIYENGIPESDNYEIISEG